MVLIMNDNLLVSPIFSSASSFVEIVASDDISLAGGGDEYVTPVTAILDGGHLIFHGSLQGVDLVHFNDDHPAAEAPEGLSRALADKEGVGVLVNHFDVLLHGLVGELRLWPQGFQGCLSAGRRR